MEFKGDKTSQKYIVWLEQQNENLKSQVKRLSAMLEQQSSYSRNQYHFDSDYLPYEDDRDRDR